MFNTFDCKIFVNLSSLLHFSRQISSNIVFSLLKFSTFPAPSSFSGDDLAFYFIISEKNLHKLPPQNVSIYLLAST